jgi:hypothetical protein
MWSEKLREEKKKINVENPEGLGSIMTLEIMILQQSV